MSTIVGQMLSNKSADVIFGRLEELCGGMASSQKICELSDSDIRKTGISTAKVKFIRELTDVVLSDAMFFERLCEMADKEIMISLMSIHGIGSWSAKMFLIFALDRPDILPYEDGAFLQAYCWLYKTSDISKTSIEKRCRKWKPYSSVAARYLYRALDLGLTKEEFHLYCTPE